MRASNEVLPCMNHVQIQIQIRGGKCPQSHPFSEGSYTGNIKEEKPHSAVLRKRGLGYRFLGTLLYFWYQTVGRLEDVT